MTYLNGYSNFLLSDLQSFIYTIYVYQKRHRLVFDALDKGEWENSDVEKHALKTLINQPIKIVKYS
jgi:hypothetical protein